MYRIIKPGKDKSKEKVIYQLVCPVCGCEFECDDEYFTSLVRSITNPAATLNCPYCEHEFTIDRHKVPHIISTEVEDGNKSN